MRQQKPIIHARDHLPGGADPLVFPPGSQPGAPPGTTAQPPTTSHPGEAHPNELWHWWRFREPTYPDTSHRETPDLATNNPAYRMLFTSYNVFYTPEELFGGKAGPNADSVSMLRLWSHATEPPLGTPHNPINYFSGGASATGLEFGKGTQWSVFGWFNFTAVKNWDIFNFADDPSAHPGLWLLLNTNGSVSLTRSGTTFTSAAGLVQAGVWAYIGITLGGGRLRVYVNPGPPEPADYDATYGSAFPLEVPMAMETWGLAKGDYSAASLAAKVTANGFKSVCVRLNPPPEDLPPGMTHAAYITQLTADVDTLQAAGLQVVGWGPADATSGSDLTATGVNGWMPQVETAEQYTSLTTQLGAGAGSGLPKAVVWTEGGINSSSQVTTLNGLGVSGYAVETYAAAGETFTHADRLLWQGTQFGMTPAQSIPMIGTFRGETPADYTGLDENVLPNYGIYDIPQTSEASWAAFAELNQGTLMLSSPVIDVSDPSTTALTGSAFSIGSPNTSITSHGTNGAFEGYVTEVAMYNHAVPGNNARDLYLSGAHGDTGVVPPQDQIPAGGITPSQIAPGTSGQHLVTNPDGTTSWADDTGGGGSVALDDLTDVTTAGADPGEVLTYSAGAWSPAAAVPGTPGEKWFTGSGPPAGAGVATAIVGDWYLDSISGDYYEKLPAAAGITRRTNIQSGASSAAGTTATITRPTDAVAGDVILVAVWAGDPGVFSTPTITLPGFTQIDTITSLGASRLSVFWKYAGASEPSSYTATFSFSSVHNWWAVAYAGADPTDPFATRHAITLDSGSTTHVTGSVTPSATSDWIVALLTDFTNTSSAKTTNWTAISPAVERAEVNNNAMASGPWLSGVLVDDGAQVGATTAQTRSASTPSFKSGHHWIGSMKGGPAGGWTLRGNLKGPAGSGADFSVIDAKGDLIAGVSDNTVARLAVGSNGQILTADSAQTAGVRWATPATAPTVSYGTTLPASPVDGQEAILVDSTTNPTYQWRFRYNAGSSGSYKWEFVGGVPVSRFVGTQETTASTVAVDLATPGPSFTLPRAGEYLITLGGFMWVSTTATAVMDLYVGGGATGAGVSAFSSFVGSYMSARSSDYVFVASSAGLVATAKYRVTGATGTFGQRFITVTPMRVS